MGFKQQCIPIPNEILVKWLKSKNKQQLTQKDIAKKVGCNHTKICKIFIDCMSTPETIEKLNEILN